MLASLRLGLSHLRKHQFGHVFLLNLLFPVALKLKPQNITYCAAFSVIQTRLPFSMI